MKNIRVKIGVNVCNNLVQHRTLERKEYSWSSEINEWHECGIMFIKIVY